MHGLKTIPPSRFSTHNANGLWEYSPLLCGAGLVEGLVLRQRFSMFMWDRMPEPTLALHLHNMLVQKRYIQEPVGLYGVLQGMFQDSFFAEKVPTSAFHDALLERMQAHINPAFLRQQRKALGREQNTNLHQMMNVRFNTFFRTKTGLMMWDDADWVPERIPDSEVRIHSFLHAIRVSETKQVTDALSGKKRLYETELVKRSKAKGFTDAALLELASITESIPRPEFKEEQEAEWARHIKPAGDYTLHPRRDPFHMKEKKKDQVQGRALLEVLRLDIYADVCGRYPMSSLNYVLITTHFMLLFMDIEARFRASRHPLYIRTYEKAASSNKRHKRVELILAAMASQDAEACKLCAQAFEKLRLGPLEFNFWDDWKGDIGYKDSAVDSDGLETDQCSVM